MRGLAWVYAVVTALVPPPPLKGAATKPAPATAEPGRPPPGETVLNKALERIRNVVGKVLHAEVKGGLIPNKWDVVAFSKLGPSP